MPWWKLRDMSDEEIDEFNRKHLVEVKMSDDKLSGTAINAIFQNEQSIERVKSVREKEIWNKAIEAVAIHFENEHWHMDHIHKIRKLKK